MQRLFITLTLLLSATSAYANITMFGDYDNYDWNQGTKVIVSDEVNHWSYDPIIDNFEQKKSVDGLTFAHASCVGQNCVVVGSFNYNHPILITTQDGGKSWRQIRSINGFSTLVNYAIGSFTDSECYQERCFATGYVKDLSTDKKNLTIVYSEDGGATWAIPTIHATTVSLISCSGNHCVAVNNKAGEHALILSSDYGKSWQDATTKLSKLWLRDLTSIGQNFIAVGSFEGHEGILTSLDSGNTWQETYRVDNKFISKVKCNQAMCLAITEFTRPKLMLSKDKGQTWQELEINGDFPKNFLDTFIQKVVCNDKTCAAIGKYSLGKDYMPFILVVNNDKYVIASQKLDQTLEPKDAQCDENNCYIAASRTEKDKKLPALLQSNGDLMSWRDISDKSYQQDVRSVTMSVLALSK